MSFLKSTKTNSLKRSTTDSNAFGPEYELIVNIFDSMLNKTVEQNMMESIHNFDADNVYNANDKKRGVNVIGLSANESFLMIKKLKQIFSDSRMWNKHIMESFNDEELWEDLVNNIIALQDKTFLEYIITGFDHIRNTKDSVDMSTVILLKLFYPSFSYLCKDLDVVEDHIIAYFEKTFNKKKKLSKFFGVGNSQRYMYMMAKHIRLAYGCNFGNKKIIFKGGGKESKPKTKTTYKGKSYVVHTGTRGGKYIMCEKKKIYV